MKKPHWFRALDFATMTVGGFIAVGVIVYGLLHPDKVEGPKEWVYLTGLVALLFFGIWARYAYLRKKWLDSFTWIPMYGFMVQPEDYTLSATQEFDSVVRRTIEAWTKFHPDAMTIMTRSVKWVWFKKGLDETPINPARMKVNGLTFPGSYSCYVDYDNKFQSLETTALEHELGHIIHGHATGQWNQNEHHEFARKNKLK